MPHSFTVFSGGSTGAWRVGTMTAVRGEVLPTRPAITVSSAMHLPEATTGWPLIGVTSHTRYATKAERAALQAAQVGLGRPEATCAALIPIAKAQQWWDLSQEERRAIFEERSRHIAASLRYLPEIQRQLYHCRDLGQPFDFLTWFEFAPRHTALFDELVGYLRTTEEWRYVTREVDIRLRRD